MGTTLFQSLGKCRSFDYLCSGLCAAIIIAACRYAAELGAAGAAGPGSLRVSLLDHLYQLGLAASREDGQQQLLTGLRISTYT
jgi:hydroxyethylthiazole kinase-like sugar kinase family protein